MGIAILPRFMVKEALAQGRLVVILPQWHLDFGDIYLVYPSKRHLPENGILRISFCPTIIFNGIVSTVVFIHYVVVLWAYAVV